MWGGGLHNRERGAEEQQKRKLERKRVNQSQCKQIDLKAEGEKEGNEERNNTETLSERKTNVGKERQEGEKGNKKRRRKCESLRKRRRKKLQRGSNE